MYDSEVIELNVLFVTCACIMKNYGYLLASALSHVCQAYRTSICAFSGTPALSPSFTHRVTHRVWPHPACRAGLEA